MRLLLILSYMQTTQLVLGLRLGSHCPGQQAAPGALSLERLKELMDANALLAHNPFIRIHDSRSSDQAIVDRWAATIRAGSAIDYFCTSRVRAGAAGRQVAFGMGEHQEGNTGSGSMSFLLNALDSDNGRFAETTAELVRDYSLHVTGY